MLERGALRVGRRGRVNFDASRLTTGRHPGSHNVPPGRLMHETRARAFYPPLEPRRPSPSAPATPASIYTHLGRSQSAQEHATTAQKTPRCGWCISSSVERRRNFLGISPPTGLTASGAVAATSGLATRAVEAHARSAWRPWRAMGRGITAELPRQPRATRDA